MNEQKNPATRGNAGQEVTLGSGWSFILNGGKQPGVFRDLLRECPA